MLFAVFLTFQYVALLVFILLSTFATGMVLTDFRTSVSSQRYASCTLNHFN